MALKHTFWPSAHLLIGRVSVLQLFHIVHSFCLYILLSLLRVLPPHVSCLQRERSQGGTNVAFVSASRQVHVDRRSWRDVVERGEGMGMDRVGISAGVGTWK